MVPTRLLLEGRDLEELLAQVRAEHGPDAVVVSAEKVRTGGVGGLFGTQKYELTVEIPDAAETTEPARTTGRKDDTPRAALTIEDLAAMADAAEFTGKKTAASPDSAAAFAQALADAEDADRAKRPQTAADALNRLLAGEAAATPEGSATPSVRPFRPNANQPIAKLGVRQVNTGPARPAENRTEAPRSGPHRSQRSHPEPPIELWQESPMPVDTTATVEKPRPPDASERLASAYNPHGVAPSGPALDRGPAERTSSQQLHERGAPQQGHERPERQTGLGRRLQSLGVPTDIALRATSADTYAAVVEAFSALPTAEPAPDGPGETLIVVGESTHAVDVARWVAETHRLDAGHVLFAGRNALAAGIDEKHRITGAHDARLWAKKLRKSDAPSVVAVEAALDESNWAAAIVEAVRPVAVWVVVDASRKTSDVAHHLQGLRRVDAICLRGTMSSGDPASPLSLRLPVALLDGRPSTPYQWAAMLCERLSLVGG